MSHERDMFSFQLSESIYFERGQEVADIKGIALDPDISIHAYEEYISIRGVIELQGEYVKAKHLSEEDRETLEYDDFHSRRYVEKVVETTEGTAEFSHRFPVEISIPAYRVADLDDVTVSIESFDYNVPDVDQLRLTSTIVIHGIMDESKTEADDHFRELEDNESLPTSADQERFAFDITQTESTESQATHEIKEVSEKLPETELDADTDRWFTKKSQTIAEFLDEKTDDASSETETEPEPAESAEHYDDELDVMHLDESLDEVENDSDEVQDVRYLSDMFREEEEHFTKVRFCIVQERDTIESIASRYAISPGQLVKQNRLADETIYEGQLLTIPYQKKNK
ncbi:MAG TPA: stage VI sporulation protein D [Bacillota bacterium]|nr:stage VI sporulation protein D [Bacillota bacterium]